MLHMSLRLCIHCGWTFFVDKLSKVTSNAAEATEAHSVVHSATHNVCLSAQIFPLAGVLLEPIGMLSYCSVLGDIKWGK